MMKSRMDAPTMPLQDIANRPAGCSTAPDAAAGAVRRRPILGIDPGLQRTGYAFLCQRITGDVRLIEAGIVRLNPKQTLELRLVELERSLDELIRAHQPIVLACEQLYSHYKHPRTAILMGHARGVILALAARHGLAVLPMASTNVKKLLTGNGHAGKVQMQRAVAAALQLLKLPEPHDVADAIAIALCGIYQKRAAAAVAGAGS